MNLSPSNRLTPWVARLIIANAVVLLLLLHTIAHDASSLALFSLWIGGGVGACALGASQLWRSLDGYRYRPRLEHGLRAPLVRVGLPNHLLTLTERAPGLILPILVTELLSPTQNAYWYAVWMMAWVVYIIPISMGMALFAEASHRPESLARAVRSGVGTSLLFGVASAGAIAVLAGPLLGLLGARYADAGATPLRILLIAFVPLTLVQVYFASCRATGKLTEAIVTGMVSGVVAVGAAAVAAGSGGLAGMAWTCCRLRRASQGTPCPAPGTGAAGTWRAQLRRWPGHLGHLFLVEPPVLLPA